MAQVESLIGFSAHKLRIWERCYEFLKPGRTIANIRFYSDKELVKLLNIGVLIRNGHKISRIDSMPDSEMHELVTGVLAKISPEKQAGINTALAELCPKTNKYAGFYKASRNKNTFS